MDLLKHFDSSEDADVCVVLRSGAEKDEEDGVASDDGCVIVDVEDEQVDAPSSSMEPLRAKLLPGSGPSSTRASSTHVFLHSIFLKDASPYFKARLSSAWQNASAAGTLPPSDRAQSSNTRHVLYLVEPVEPEEVQAAYLVLRSIYAPTGSMLPTDLSCMQLLRLLLVASRMQVQRCVDAGLAALQQLPSSSWDTDAISLIFSAPTEALLLDVPAAMLLRRLATKQLLQMFSGTPWLRWAEEQRQFCSLPHAAVLSWMRGCKELHLLPGAAIEPAAGSETKPPGAAHVADLVTAWTAARGNSLELEAEMMQGLGLPEGQPPSKPDVPGWQKTLALLRLHAQLRATAAVAWLRGHPRVVAALVYVTVCMAVEIALLACRGSVCQLAPRLAAWSACGHGVVPLLLFGFWSAAAATLVPALSAVVLVIVLPLVFILLWGICFALVFVVLFVLQMVLFLLYPGIVLIGAASGLFSAKDVQRLPGLGSGEPLFITAGEKFIEVTRIAKLLGLEDA